MQKLFSRFFSCLLCLLMLMPLFSATEESGLESEIRGFMIENGLDASNFSMSYYDLVSGESYTFNQDVFVPVGKLRFLPTHMYFYEEETRGAFEPLTPEDPVFTIAGMTLEECRYHSIILAEDAISDKMQSQIGTVNQYLELINQRYGMLDPNTLPREYWTGKSLSPRFLMNCIRIVSSQPELFTGLMANYSMVQQADAFADGSVSYPIVQIRGEEDGYITAVAEVSAARNFLLVASVKTVSGGDAVLGKLNQTICNYLLENATQNGEDVVTQATTIQNAPNYYIGEERLESDGTLSRWLTFSFSIAAVLTAIGLGIWFYWRAQHRQY